MKPATAITLVAILVGCSGNAFDDTPGNCFKTESLPPSKEDGVAAIEKLGGTVRFDPRAHGKPVIAVGFDEVKISDDDLVLVKEFKILLTLSLNHTAITDDGLKHLKDLTRLRVLFLSDTKITNAGLAHLKGMTSLESLVLTDTNVTDSGLKYLERLKKLKVIQLSGTTVTESGVAKLKNSLPKCRIVR